MLQAAPPYNGLFKKYFIFWAFPSVGSPKGWKRLWPYASKIEDAMGVIPMELASKQVYDRTSDGSFIVRIGTKMLRTPLVFVMFVLAFYSANAQAEDRRSVEKLIQGCRYEALRPAPVQDSEWSEAFQCRDAIAESVRVGPIQPKMLSSCVPETLSPHIIAKAVVDFLEQHPERYHERFDIRSAAALHSAWPCP